MEYPLIPRFANAITIRVFPTGQRRTTKDPPADLLKTAFDELGTHVAVAAAFGVTRRVVKRWLSENKLEVVSRPEARFANAMRERLDTTADQDELAQWLMDEGSISVAHSIQKDTTILLVCGSMCDYEVLSRISRILGAPITSSKVPFVTALPMGAVRVQGARAYAVLQILLPKLVGLKRMEAEEALRFFPPSGIVRGRHTTDEFLAKAWKEHAHKTLHEWNSRRRIKASEGELNSLARTWVQGRIRRARRFLDAKPLPKARP